jgi:murein endopeptidase
MSATALLGALALQSSPIVAQPMGPWLDEALPTQTEEPVQKIGECPTQYLSGGVQLQPSPELYKIWQPDQAWGRPEMIEVLTRAAEEMAWLMPEADPIVVGDISTRYGGFLDGHKSHRAGIDADIGLYWGNGRMHMGGFRDVHPDNLDLEANWLLIKSLLDTGLVERILLDQRLILRLKRYTIESGELSPDEADRIFPSGYTRMWTHTGVVHHAPSHKEHMHVRTFCWASST